MRLCVEERRVSLFAVVAVSSFIRLDEMEMARRIKTRTWLGKNEADEKRCSSREKRNGDPVGTPCGDSRRGCFRISLSTLLS